MKTFSYLFFACTLMFGLGLTQNAMADCSGTCSCSCKGTTPSGACSGGHIREASPGAAAQSCVQRTGTCKCRSTTTNPRLPSTDGEPYCDGLKTTDSIPSACIAN